MLTVVMATHNGADTIGRCLEAFCNLTTPDGSWQLVVVDNASTDATPAQLDMFRGRLPLVIVQEPRLGKSYALNAGLRHVEGDLVIFADDDILPERDWLVEWQAASRRYPDIAVFGGAIDPRFENPPPEWLWQTGWMGMLYAQTTDQEEGPIASEKGEIFGPNMAVRRLVIDTGHRFDTRFMHGHSGLMGDETDFVDRAARDGFALGFAPKARVGHIVSPRQVQAGWLVRRFYRHGRSMRQHRIMRFGRPAAPCLFGVPRYLIVRVGLTLLRLPRLLGQRNALERWRCIRQIAYDFGEMRQAYKGGL